MKEQIAVSRDAPQLGRVLEALLDNARKYAKPGGRVWVRLERRGRGRCLLTVADQGEPIPPDTLEHLFERFYRADLGGEPGGDQFFFCGTALYLKGSGAMRRSLFA